MTIVMRSLGAFAAVATLLVSMAGHLAHPAAAQTPAEDVTAATRGELGEQVLASCKTELARFCPDVTPGEGRLLSCLYAHGDKLGSQCDYALHTAAARLERAVSAITYVASECRAEIESHCAGMAAGHGRVAQCLKAHKGELSPGCDLAMTEVGLR